MRLALCALAAALALTTAAVPASQPAVTEIVVSGTGSVALPPDIATVDAAVETNAANANEAVSQNNTLYNRIVAALEAAGVGRDDISLAYYNMNYNPRPQNAAPNPGERYGYTVSRGFNVKVRDIARAGSVADACTNAGATSINGVSFGLANPNAARAQATAKAVADARSNAQALADAAHLRIVSIKSLELGGGGRVMPMPMMKLNTVAAAVPTEFDQSNVSVTASVTVTFLAAP